ncbi:MAG: protein DA1 [Bacteroidales bacterium]|nr:protein DA1 [Bacteroidales bacterium]
MDKITCVICGKTISGKYLLDPWDNPACLSHEHISCCSCFRFIGKYSSYSPITKQIGFNLADGRYVCGLCQETSVVNKEQVKKSADFVLNLLAKAGFNIPHGKISVSLVTQTEMEKKYPGAQGLCCSQFLVDHPETTTAKIYIHHGLPKMVFEGTLAHEILHFWLHYNGIEESESEEGFCNIGKALVQNYYAAIRGSEFAAKLRKWTNENSDYYYGTKFLEQKQILQNMGWKKYIENILRNKRIPK